MAGKKKLKKKLKLTGQAGKAQKRLKSRKSKIDAALKKAGA